MRTLLASLTAVVILSSSVRADDEKIVSPVELPQLELKSPGRGKPILIGTADELAKLVQDKEARETIEKAVDLKQFNLVIFSWAGSGQDRLTSEVEKGKNGPIVKFTLIPGRTRDLRQHLKGFAVSKKATIQ